MNYKPEPILPLILPIMHFLIDNAQFFYAPSVQLRHGIRVKQRKAMNLIIEIFMT